MKKLILTLLILFTARFAFADSILIEGFEYGNHDGETPVGWVCDDNSWLAGYLEKDHNRTPHAGNWYAYTNADDSWMFMDMFMSSELKYRYYLWAISDGEFDVEVWAGNGASVNEMTTMLFTQTINSDEYIRIAEYIETIASDYQFFGIHAIAHEGASTLTIDDITVNMVGKYDIIVNPANYYTLAAPGSQVEFDCVFTNLGYEPANTFITANSEYFTDVHLYKDGVACTSFHTEPDESVYFTGIATFTSDIELGSLGWVDIMFTLDCDCATTMFTLWATAGYESVDELNSATSIYPNPSKGNVTIEGNGVMTITNTLGQEIIRKEIVEKETVTLDNGVYFIKINDIIRKVIIQ